MVVLVQHPAQGGPIPRWCRAISEKSSRDPKGPARPAPATGGNSPGTGLGTNTYTNDYISAQADCAQYIELLAP